MCIYSVLHWFLYIFSLLSFPTIFENKSLVNNDKRISHARTSLENFFKRIYSDNLVLILVNRHLESLRLYDFPVKQHKSVSQSVCFQGLCLSCSFCHIRNFIHFHLLWNLSLIFLNQLKNCYAWNIKKNAYGTP
jgi:hypothetical protein